MCMHACKYILAGELVAGGEGATFRVWLFQSHVGPGDQITSSGLRARTKTSRAISTIQELLKSYFQFLEIKVMMALQKAQHQHPLNESTHILNNCGFY